MGNNYSNFLTMLLIILIVAILGIIAYFSYDLFISNSINSNAHSAIEEFENSRKPVVKDTSNIKENDDEPEESEEREYELLEITPNKVEVPQKDNKMYMEDYEIMGTIKIPKTGIEYPVLECVTKRSLELAVAIAYGPGFNGVGNLNDIGNTVIYGHNYRKSGMFFSDNKKLTSGDEIYITDKSGKTVAYRIYKVYQTTGDDASFFTRDTEGKREISLQTCTDNSEARIIILAREK